MKRRIITSLFIALFALSFAFAFDCPCAATIGVKSCCGESRVQRVCHDSTNKGATWAAASIRPCHRCPGPEAAIFIGQENDRSFDRYAINSPVAIETTAENLYLEHGIGAVPDTRTAQMPVMLIELLLSPRSPPAGGITRGSYQT